MDLLCPKCQAPMRHIERNGVVIDRCTECGGVFLDRGELEHLIRAEAVFTESRPAGSRGYHADDDDDDDGDDRHSSHQGRPPRRKRRNFLEEIFDFG
jgi:Zn-finger nucleic acid-binding protein